MPRKNLLDVAKLGEKLSYMIKWKGVPAGEAIFTVKPWQTRVDGRPAFYLVLETESNDFISTFHKVRDKVKSYIDTETGHSLYFVRNIREGKYSADDFLRFDYEKDLQYYSSLKTKGSRIKKSKKDPRPIPGYVQDPLSVIYYLRHFKLDPKNPLKILVGSRKTTTVMRVDVMREGKLVLPGLGKFEVNIAELGAGDSGKDGYKPKIFVAKGKVTVWAEKNTNIPLMVQVGVPILGTADVVLYKTENCELKDHALSAK
jgi:hypothetical protein